ncbi:Uncharacterized protein APZ42_011266 [Daphnia magna]|uniref:Uncharacterized protein n=1 Tax=Daphnia magna TaxID=35525 RepID=A0A162SIR3_9CRUS|nr:Uncharacterized protein APZ42_011266 [Daphnia magna]
MMREEEGGGVCPQGQTHTCILNAAATCSSGIFKISGVPSHNQRATRRKRIFWCVCV